MAQLAIFAIVHAPNRHIDDTEPGFMTDTQKTRQPQRKWRRRLFILSLTVVVAAGAIVFVASRAPGTDPLAVKVAVWGRAHGLGFAITTYERVVYRLHPPKVGGTATIAVTPRPSATAHRHSGITAPIRPVAAGPAIAHEGAWQTVVTQTGRPVVQIAYVRPDSEHTSYLTAVMLIDHSQVRLQLHPGYEDPKSPSRFNVPDRITQPNWRSLVAAFNSGFKLSDARGGFYLNGVTAAPLRAGAASLVTYTDGSFNIGSWGTDVTMSPAVESVRQNLRLLVDNARVTASADAAVKSSWGGTLGGAYFVWRTGVGVKANGDLVFALGDSLSARTLARVLRAAGAVRAMQMDINPDWAAAYWFSQPAANAESQRPKAHKPLPFKKPLYRWFSATSRDFYSVHLRSEPRP